MREIIFKQIEIGMIPEDWGINEEELAFDDALEVNDSAVKILGDDAHWIDIFHVAYDN